MRPASYVFFFSNFFADRDEESFKTDFFEKLLHFSLFGFIILRVFWGVIGISIECFGCESGRMVCHACDSWINRTKYCFQSDEFLHRRRVEK